MGGILRDTGIASLRSNISSLWSADYQWATTKWFEGIAVGRTFSGEYLNRMARVHGVGKPHHPNAWSAMAGIQIKRWLKSGAIKIVGFEPCVRAQARARRAVTYVKVK